MPQHFFVCLTENMKTKILEESIVMVSLRNFTLQDMPVFQKEPTYDKSEELAAIIQ